MQGEGESGRNMQVACRVKGEGCYERGLRPMDLGLVEGVQGEQDRGRGITAWCTKQEGAGS